MHPLGSHIPIMIEKHTRARRMDRIAIFRSVKNREVFPAAPREWVYGVPGNSYPIHCLDWKAVDGAHHQIFNLAGTEFCRGGVERRAVLKFRVRKAQKALCGI